MDATLADAEAALRTSDPGRHQEGVRIIERLNQQGEPTAAYAIATWHLEGLHGYECNVELALPYLQYAAAQGQPEAAYDLAVVTETAKLGRQPRRDAFAGYLLALALGQRQAIEEVARCLLYGIGTLRNEAAAERLYELLESEQRGAQRLAAE